MDAETWKKHIQYFLEAHPTLHEAGENVFVPIGDYTVAFIFSGGLRIAGDAHSLEVNYNNPDLLILSVYTEVANHTYRLAWEHLVAFELMRDNETGSELPWPPSISMN